MPRRPATDAGVAKLVDAPDLGSGIERCGGSSPFARTRIAARHQHWQSNEIPALEGVRVEKMQTVETLNEGLKRAFTLTIHAKDIYALVEKELNNPAPQVRVPGFSPGNAP